MQHYSHPEVFLCPYYNFPGIANPKMHISEEGFDRPPRFCPAPGPSQALLTTPMPASPSASPQSSSPSSRGNSFSPAEPRSQGSEAKRKAEDYDRIFEELIDAE